MSKKTEEKDTIQRPRRKRGKKLLLLLVLLVLIAAAAVGVYRLFFTEEEKVAVTGKTTFGSLNEAIEGSGTTVPVDSSSYSVSGKVLEWYVEAGAEVKAGDILYVLDASEAEDELLGYEAELEELNEKMEELQTNISNQWVTAPFAGRIEKVQATKGKNVQSGSNQATLVDNSVLEATLYFSYAYEKEIRKGMTAVVSVPDQMLNLSGKVTEIHYVDYVTKEGMRCFAVTIQVENPGALTEGVKVTCWVETADGPAYAVDDTTLKYHRTETVTADANGELTDIRVVDYQRVSAGEILFEIDTSSYETQIETLQKQIASYEKKIADLQKSIDTEYTRYADISGQVVNANYSTNRMTGKDSGTVTIYNQETMQISINVDELDADYLEKGMDVYVYRTTSSRTVSYPAIPSNNAYMGFALRAYSSYESVVSLAELQKEAWVENGDVFLHDGQWYAKIDGYEVPISAGVQVFMRSTGQWLEGEAGLKAALTMGTDMNMYYDRGMTTGAQVRVIEVSEQ